ncbi:MAG: tetratricopeptide repeat protein [Oscillatoriales cyanobacterium]|uniref:Tetratricopeptide repeat protein n=1 Tax=Microcoleus anatoxicus PTRS2 TaxID=2705321 RepID=A0ABU8YQV3_9CYAN|nr:MAG: tetratricopeptide repeat protein [Oscillatoriales cyanobacterium]TAD92992.1 MAG: tetratricopeptide repeat protein [Oscillatoriales cyanobacterium]TAF06026.1 MAG: tetratricopeptide repeat protein [Oscillatoriales cyanobacterium]TAF64622.1 MAG: tetratricopeptide repeat protein [Oscillatoriales cyanobacterium]
MTDIHQIVTALEDKEYKQAAQLIKKLQTESPENPWVKYYMARYYELTNHPKKAETTYKQILRDITNPKIISQARQGIQRIETATQDRLQQAIETAKNDPSNLEPALLILEAVSPEDKPAAIQNISRILKTDAYTTRMQVQSRGWRLYKTGPIAEIQIYGQELLNAGIPVFWGTLADIQKIQIFRVEHFQSLSSPAVICKDNLNRLGSIAFNWSEVSQRVEGLLPMFMDIMDYSPHRRTDQFRHKEITQDYAQICDLHIPSRHCILRICDQSYEFQQGIDFTQISADIPASAPKKPKSGSQKPLQVPQSTTRINWNHLLEILDQQLDVTVWSEFTPFAETVLDYTHMLSNIESYVEVDRKSETPWDPAFQLYSGLAFLKNLGNR